MEDKKQNRVFNDNIWYHNNLNMVQREIYLKKLILTISVKKIVKVCCLRFVANFDGL